MPLVKRGNKELTVRVDELNKYLSCGYDVIDEKGNILQSRVSNDVAGLKEKNAELERQVAEYKTTVDKQATELETLTAERDELKKQTKASK